MHPPEWVSKEVERVNPLARLGWDGKSREFAVLDLYPKRLADKTFKTLWDGRGPVFGSDYDHLQRVPVWIANIPVADVFSGKVVLTVKRFIDDIQERLDRTWREEQEYQKRNKKELAGEVGSYMHWKSKKCLHATNTIADKHITKEEKAFAAGDVERAEEKPPPVHGIGMT